MAQITTDPLGVFIFGDVITGERMTKTVPWHLLHISRFAGFIEFGQESVNASGVNWTG